DLDSDRRTNACGEQVHARLDRHGPCIRSARYIERLVHLFHQLVGGDVVRRKPTENALRPFGRPGRIPGVTFRHSASGLRTITVSIMENGAGSVDVSARPALP